MWANIFELVMKIALNIQPLIQTAEVAFSGVPGQSGPAKKAFVMGLVQIGLTADQSLAPHPLTAAQSQVVTATTSLLIDSGVATMNAVKAMMPQPPPVVAPPVTVPPVVLPAG
jgi:hypothetical protein